MMYIHTSRLLFPATARPPPRHALKVVPSLQTSSVYSFLATITKDHGEIDASVELLTVRIIRSPPPLLQRLGHVDMLCSSHLAAPCAVSLAGYSDF